MDLTVLLPTLNEAANLALLLPELRRTLDRLTLDYEILVVDGGSTDATDDVARVHQARLLVQGQSGYGCALLEGFSAARGEYVLTMDADYSHAPDFVESLWSERGNSDLVIASRYVPAGRAEMNLLRASLSRILNNVYRHALDLPFRDLSSGFRLYRMAALEVIEPEGRNFELLPELLVRLHAEGFRIREIPFHYRPRERGRSHAKLIRFGWAFLKTLLRMRRLRNSTLSADYDKRAFDSAIPFQRYWQRERYRIIMSYLERGERTLDVGCGSSRIVLDLPKAVGVDVQVKKLRYLRDRVPMLLAGSLDHLPFKENSFNQIICSEVIEHVPKDKVCLSEFSRVLEPGGKLILGTPDYSSKAWRMLEWVYKKVKPGGYADEHINQYTREGLQRELEENGFSIEALQTICGAEMIFKACTRQE